MSKRSKETVPKDLRIFRQAAMHNREFAETMLKQCPDLVRQQDGVGETPLHYCAIEGFHDAVQWLVSKGACVNTRDHSNGTPLIHAAQLGHLEVCKILLKAGADVTAIDNIESDTALHAAARNEHVEICELLLKAGAPANKANGDGAHPWDLALPRKKAQVHEVLCQYGGSASLPT